MIFNPLQTARLIVAFSLAWIVDNDDVELQLLDAFVAMLVVAMEASNDVVVAYPTVHHLEGDQDDGRERAADGGSGLHGGVDSERLQLLVRKVCYYKQISTSTIPWNCAGSYILRYNPLEHARSSMKTMKPTL